MNYDRTHHRSDDFMPPSSDQQKYDTRQIGQLRGSALSCCPQAGRVNSRSADGPRRQADENVDQTAISAMQLIFEHFRYISTRT
jgi:hypothetical protein